MSNLETVRHIYAALGRGDIPAILERLSESVEWEYGENSTDVPWLQPGRGRAYVAEFFARLAPLLEVHRLEHKTFLESGNIVVVLFDLDMTVKPTRRRIVEVDEVNIWHFDPAGRVTRFRHRADTHQHMLAYHDDLAKVPPQPANHT
jgi:ketosteroid isomerase-like protein